MALELLLLDVEEVSHNVSEFSRPASWDRHDSGPNQISPAAVEANIK